MSESGQSPGVGLLFASTVTSSAVTSCKVMNMGGYIFKSTILGSRQLGLLMESGSEWLFHPRADSGEVPEGLLV